MATFRFGAYLLDDETRRLERSGRPVHLTPKAFQLLHLLVSRRPRAVSRPEIRDALWPDTIVAESNLTVLIAELRRALREESRDGRFLRTVHGFGYAFAVPGPSVDLPVGAWILRLPDREVLLGDGETILGRGAEADVRLPASQVSRRHVRIVVHGREATVEDLGSRHGTRLEDRPLAGPEPLAVGDVLEVGPYRIKVAAVAADDGTTTE